MLQRETNYNLSRSAKRARRASSIPNVALLLVGGMVVSMLCPVGRMVDKAQATDGGVATLSSYLPSSVTLTLSDKVEGEIEPKANGTFSSISTIARVQVNNSDQYSVLISGEANMTNKAQAANDAKISSVDGATSGTDFKANTWGYNVVEGKNTTAGESAVYSPVGEAKVVSTKLLKDTKGADDYYTLSFGAKVDNTLPAGSYSSTVTLSTVASPRLVVGFDETDTMQGLTASICRNVDAANATHETDIEATDSLGNTYYTKRLKDLRDGKYYWVAKLADGNCWMTQNLALDITKDGLTPELSDITEPWNSQSEYPPVETSNNTVTANTNATGTFSWNLGEFVFKDPINVNLCALMASSIVECTEQFLQVGTRKPSMDANFYATYKDSYSDTEYDAHYLIGNYYQWNAATAGTGGNLVNNENATGSICPKNWTLPTLVDGDAEKSSYKFLMDQYEKSAEIYATSPLYFVRAGSVLEYEDEKGINQAGKYGCYWYKTAFRETLPNAAWNMYIQSSIDFNPWYRASKDSGLSVRCLVNTVD